MKFMKDSERKIETVFDPDTRFELEHDPTVPFRGTIEGELELLKARLLRARLAETVQLDAPAPFRRAANEAAALAWLTAFPLLVFPTLFEEKLHQIRLQM